MEHEKFDVARIERLDDPKRFRAMDPDVMWAAAGSLTPRTILDIGAGTGLFARRFAAMAPDAIVYAADTAPEMVRWMEEHADPVLEGRVRPLLADESHILLPDETADLVVMIALHHELADPAASYAEALRLMRTGGSLLVVDWSPGGDAEGPPQRIRATPEQAIAVLDSVGFRETAHHEGLPNYWIVTARK